MCKNLVVATILIVGSILSIILCYQAISSGVGEWGIGAFMMFITTIIGTVSANNEIK